MAAIRFQIAALLLHLSLVFFDERSLDGLVIYIRSLARDLLFRTQGGPYFFSEPFLKFLNSENSELSVAFFLFHDDDGATQRLSSSRISSLALWHVFAASPLQAPEQRAHTTAILSL
jgi:hypothetical protein